MVQTTSSSSTPAHTGILVRLLFAPLIYAVYFGVVYFFVEAACTGGPVLEGRTINSVVLAATAGALALLAVWTVVAFVIWWRLRRTGQREEATIPARQDFYALVTLLLSLLFMLVTAATGVPALFLDACSWA